MIRICAVTTIKAPLRDTLSFVAYHLRIGLDQLILFFDDPDDAAIAHLSADKRVTCIACDAAHWRRLGMDARAPIERRQLANFNLGLRIARFARFEWITHLDSDELLLCRRPIASLLSAVAVNLVVLASWEAVPERLESGDLFAPRLFKTRGRPWQMAAAAWLGCRRPFFNGEYFRGYARPKGFLRIDDDIGPEEVADPWLSPASRTVAHIPDIVILHFDCTGLEAWKRKWKGRLDGSATAIAMRQNRAEQAKLFDDAEKRGDAALAALYRRLYLMSLWDRIVLRCLGLLTTVRIDSALLSPTTSQFR